MTIAPRYNFDAGTEISVQGHSLVLHKVGDSGYELSDTDGSVINVLGFSKFVELVKSGGVKFNARPLSPQGSAGVRLKGFSVAAQMTEKQQAYGRFHYAICVAIDQLYNHRTVVEGQNDFRISIGSLNNNANRKFLRQIVEAIFGERVYLECSSVKGGHQEKWFLYKGRTLKKYYDVYLELQDDDDIIAALVTLDHLKGNRKPRLPWRLKELMTEAWETIGLDLKGPSPANVHAYLTALINRENKQRSLNGLPTLPVPSQQSLIRHRQEQLTPTEFVVATQGVRFARNKRGRGSSDVRALMPGEFCEMDECRASLITSAKAKGYWHTLSKDIQEAMAWADEEIRSRLTILVMIDVATRMPLAWVVSDQPKAKATMQLLRMATRDKTREKRIYGCDGEPMPPLGLGMVRNDNGTGLRNSEIKTALLGLSSTITDVRAHASADKPYVERMFGTTEAMLLKLLHGYTGRKPGELPGYDATKSGVLNIDHLYEILTKFFIDEYPSLPHMGVGMGGRRPAEVYKDLNETRGIFRPIDEELRRIHLGWKFEVKPNDEGVRVLQGLYYSSDQFQEVIDKWQRKVSVYIDPDNLNFATAVVPGDTQIYQLNLQTTVFADLTVSEYLELMTQYRHEHPETKTLYEDRIAKVRLARQDFLQKIGVERRLPRSYVTIEEARTKAKALFASSQVVQNQVPQDTVAPGSLASATSGPGVLPLGGAEVIDLEPSKPTPENEEVSPIKKPRAKSKNQTTQKSLRLGPPDELGKLS
ncbi:DDE-type integrase/transposase/recombinase [Celeribacter halophilus]|uniref:DDE-type integrase/transposase/recombinase n=1 Tax=Celeribacter halophilus TaxID=576117 RepID=UPI001C094782|nr:DDE-type integrase/transposase/recombinase [Celeribacter halophilus]MBU2888140.1 DDE-type integrase/transposase/recombinase [Celeribacter halophilus]MDO6511885.1 DDE-type integrase/transposase/recombinase [Celeribacter halophilus]